MKKNIIIIILSITTILGFVYSFAQRTIAQQNALEAIKQTEFAETARNEAEISQQLALVAEHRAIESKRAADEALRKCNEELEMYK